MAAAGRPGSTPLPMVLAAARWPVGRRSRCIGNLFERFVSVKFSLRRVNSGDRNGGDDGMGGGLATGVSSQEVVGAVSGSEAGAGRGMARRPRFGGPRRREQGSGLGLLLHPGGQGV